MLIENMYHTRGIQEGVTALHARLLAENGPLAAPARADVAQWLRREPSAQIARMPRKDVSIAPVLPPPQPLSRVFADTMILPRTGHNSPGVGYKVYRAIVVFVDALTKFVSLHGVFQLVQGRPVSQQTRDGAIEFIRRARIAARDPNLHPSVFVVDKGSEWLGAFENWRGAENAANRET